MPSESFKSPIAFEIAKMGNESILCCFECREVLHRVKTDGPPFIAMDAGIVEILEYHKKKCRALRPKLTLIKGGRK